MKKRTLAVIVCAVLLLTTALILLHLNQDEMNEGNSVALRFGSRKVLIVLDKLNQVNFSGLLTNGKGETSEARFRGVELQEILRGSGFSIEQAKSAWAVSQDQYSAVLGIEEIMLPGKVYIAVEENGRPLPGLAEGSQGAQLIVFGDTDRKRCVMYLEAIELSTDENP